MATTPIATRISTNVRVLIRRAGEVVSTDVTSGWQPGACYLCDARDAVEVGDVVIFIDAKSGEHLARFTVDEETRRGARGVLS